MPSRAYEVYIKLEKVLKATSAKSPNELAGRTDMVESTAANGYNGAIYSSLPFTFLSCNVFRLMTSVVELLGCLHVEPEW